MRIAVEPPAFKSFYVYHHWLSCRKLPLYLQRAPRTPQYRERFQPWSISIDYTPKVDFVSCDDKLAIWSTWWSPVSTCLRNDTFTSSTRAFGEWRRCPRGKTKTSYRDLLTGEIETGARHFTSRAKRCAKSSQTTFSLRSSERKLQGLQLPRWVVACACIPIPTPTGLLSSEHCHDSSRG